MASQPNISRRMVLLSAALTLTGCGGGGTPATPEGSPTPVPSDPSQTWGTAVEVRRASWGGNSGALMADGSVLMLSDLVGMDPEVLSAVRIDANGSLGSPITVKSFENPFNGARPHFYNSMVVAATTDGAFIAWRETVPNGRNSDEYQRLQICRYRTSTGLQPPVVITASAGSILTYSLASMSGDGALLAWIETAPEDPIVSPRGPTSLYVATYTDAAGWAPPVRLTTSTPDQPIFLSSVAAGASTLGHLAVLWAQKNGADWGDTLLASTCAPSGTWTAPDMVYAMNDVEKSTCNYLAIAPDSLGNAIAVWEYTSWDTKVRRSALNRFNTGGGWQGPRDISPWAITPSVAVNAQGQGLLAWSDNGGVYGVDFGSTGFGAVKALSLDDAWAPRVSMGDGGRGSVFWEQVVFDHGAHVSVYGASFRGASGWSKSSNVSPLPEIARLSDVTNMRGGRAAVIWNQGDISALQSSFWLAPFEVRSA